MLDVRQSRAITDYISVDPAIFSEDGVNCPACGEPVRMLRWLPPHRAEIETWGAAFGDIVFGTGDDLFVSERLLRLWKKEKLVGLQGFHPVTVMKVIHRRKRIGPPPRYFQVEVARSRAAIDAAASGLKRMGPRPKCEECRIGSGESGEIKGWRRIILEPGTWTGEDIFIVRGLPGIYLTSSRFKEFCDTHAVLNAVLVPAETYDFKF